MDKRHLGWVVIALLAIPAIGVAAPSVYDQLWGGGIEEDLCFLADGVELPNTDCAPATTTTTSTSTTTTQPTTTTSAPTTTSTTIDAGLVIPPTEPYPSRGLPESDGFTFMLTNAETGTFWWDADYWGDGGLYQPGAKSLPGDREGYRCGYGFYADGSGDIIGRYSFVRPLGQAYGKVNDRYMPEAQRYLDGTLHTAGTNEIQDEDCTDVRSPIDYDGACRPVDERPRIGFFDGQGNVIDIRDYTNTVANNIVFNLHSVSEDRVTVIACEDGLVGMIVYYDSMGDGQVVAELD